MEFDYGKQKSLRTILAVDREIDFTRAYLHFASLHPFQREAHCHRIQTQAIMQSIEPGDWFAGRSMRMFVGIDPERGDLTEAAYFCQFDLLRLQLKNNSLPAKTIEDIQYLLAFWEQHHTYKSIREAFTEHLQKGLPHDDYYSGREISYPMFGLGGPCLDFDKLLQWGIPGLQQKITRKLDSVQSNSESYYFLSSALFHLETLTFTLLRYAAEADQMAKLTTNSATAKKATYISQSCRSIATNPPKTYHQAIQLMWIYALVALPKNYGRMDEYLGDFLATDLANGTLSYSEAKQMTIGLWQLIQARGDNFNNRIIIGGLGQRNPKNAEVFAKLALEVQSEVGNTIPQLSLRCHKTMNTELYSQAFDVLSKGSTFPILYNDDVIIPGLTQAFQISEEKAEQYVMYGCGELVIDHYSIGSPDAALNVLKALDVTLNNGYDSFINEPRGIATGNFNEFNTFKELLQAFSRQIEHQVALLAEAQSIIYKKTAEVAAFPLLSILYDDCIDRGLPILSGGVAQLGGTLESFGNNTAADALLAIKKIVFEQKQLSKADLLTCLKANFNGFERELQLLKSSPKYGNDNMEADSMSLWVNETVCRIAQQQAKQFGLSHFNVVLVNNGDSITLGKATAASADGRLAGTALSNGNQPGAGNDKTGITALLNSMSKLDASLHAGTTQNIRLSKSTITLHRKKIEALIQAYFGQGGSQVMITIAGKEELEQALSNPDQYSNLIVRVGGYSERFIDLPRDVQQEVIKRTVY